MNLTPPLLLAAAAMVCGGSAPQNGLSFDQRVEAQRAIERVYYSHQLSAAIPFQEAVPRELLERKVRTYLRQSAALDKFWHAPLTAATLREEAERMGRDSRMPERLRELYRALDDDPVLILECLVRPVLAARLSRQYDSSLSAGEALRQRPAYTIAKRSWDDGWSTVERDLDERQAVELADIADDESELSIPALANAGSALPSCPEDDTWDSGSLGAPESPAPRIGGTVVWTGNYVVVWGGLTAGFASTNTGGRYDPALDSWQPTSLTSAPSPRYGHSAVWTGSSMIIWDGIGDPSHPISPRGRRYNPISDTWSAMSSTNAPSPSANWFAAWTGNVMITWANGTGGRYNPATDAWSPMNSSIGPFVSRYAVAWTGARLVFWGGEAGTFNPPNPNPGPPFSYTNHGGRYDPVTDTWALTSTAGAPLPRASAKVAAMGERLIVWAGVSCDANRANCVSVPDGGSYDPISDTWLPISTAGAPVGMTGETITPAGGKLVVWGGIIPPNALDSGARYDPAANVWTPTSTTGAPSARYDHVAVWTGSHVIAWGGRAASGLMNNDGGRYGVLQSDHLIDDDGDGLSECQGDCDDTRAAVYPGATQICDGVNDDCSDPSWPSPPADEQDADHDGFGSCQGECDDTRADVHPGAPQLCDGINDNCSDPSWPAVPANEFDSDTDGFKICQGDCDDTRASVRPGAPEICDGLNNNCSSPSWPSIPPTELDEDFDQVRECEGDCDDTNPDAYARPGEAQALQFTDVSTLAWSPPAQPGGAVICYDLLRAESTAGFAGSGICVESFDCLDASAHDVETPGSIFYYLVRARNGCPPPNDAGTLGTTSDGTPRNGMNCP